MYFYILFTFDFLNYLLDKLEDLSRRSFCSRIEWVICDVTTVIWIVFILPQSLKSHSIKISGIEAVFLYFVKMYLFTNLQKIISKIKFQIMKIIQIF